MSTESLTGIAHGVLAATTAALLWWLVRRELRAGRRSAATAWLCMALGSVSVWSAHLSWFYLLGASPAQVLWLPAVGATFAAVLAWTASLGRPASSSQRLWVALWLADPVVLVGAHVVLGADAVVVRGDETFEYGPFFAVHTVLCFALLLAAASVWIGRLADPSRSLRVVARIVLAGLVATGAIEAMQLRVMNVALTAMLVAVTVVVVRAAPAALRARPDATGLLDDLGALVLVYDRDDRLVDLNAPAREFFSRDGAEAPAIESPADAVLPIAIDDALSGVDVRLEQGGEPVDFVCFAARLSSSTSPPDGSVVVLRRRAPAGPSPSAGSDADTAVGFTHEIAQLAALPGALVALGVRFEGPEDAARAAQAVRFVVGSLGTVVIGPVDECAFVTLAPAHLAPILIDVAADWQSRSSLVDDGEVGARRTVSLAPVLAGDRIVRHGQASQAPTLVAAVRDALAGIDP